MAQLRNKKAAAASPDAAALVNQAPQHGEGLGQVLHFVTDDQTLDVARKTSVGTANSIGHWGARSPSIPPNAQPLSAVRAAQTKTMPI